MSALVAMLASAGCVGSFPVLTETNRAQMGTVAVVALSDTPEKPFAGTAGRGVGAAKGALTGVFQDPRCLILAPVCVVAGAVAGAVAATPARVVSEIEGALDSTDVASHLGQQVAETIRRTAKEQARREIVPVQAPARQRKVNYDSLREIGIGSVLEVRPRLVVVPLREGPSDPDLALHLFAMFRVIRVADGEVLHLAVGSWTSPGHRASEWAADEGRPVVAATNELVQQLAQEAVEQVFVLYRSGS